MHSASPAREEREEEQESDAIPQCRQCERVDVVQRALRDHERRAEQQRDDDTLRNRNGAR